MKQQLEALRRLAARSALKGATVGGGLVVAQGMAHAAVDAAVNTGLTTAATDVGAIAALVTLVVLAIKVGKWINRAL